MAFERSVRSKTYLAASAVSAMQPVAMLGAVTAGSARDEAVQAAPSYNIFPLGVARASALAGGVVTVDLDGWVKCIAAASLGAGAPVAVGSTNGVIIPVAVTAAGPTAPPRFILGFAEDNAAAADVTTVRLAPQFLV